MEHHRVLRGWTVAAVYGAVALAFVGGLAVASTDAQAWPSWLKYCLWVAVVVLGILVFVAEMRRGRVGEVESAVNQARRSVAPWRRRRAEALVRRAAVEDGWPNLAAVHTEIHAVVGRNRRAAKQLVTSVITAAGTVRRYDLAAPVQTQLAIYESYCRGEWNIDHLEVKALVEASKCRTSAELLAASPLALKPLLHALLIGLGMAVNITNFHPRNADEIGATQEARQESGRLLGLIDTLREQAPNASGTVAGIVHEELIQADSFAAPVRDRMSETLPGHPGIFSHLYCDLTVEGYRQVRGVAR
ncbi:hypothetical protein [Streptomyces pseudovenezuelae]|uniref:hypothetical protein n=1 Tax=Streptomyces pseudovenezuelae TaxID=67350 RepID=UPI0036F0D321